jgi:sugar phosphate isomerase/epimerase
MNQMLGKRLVGVNNISRPFGRVLESYPRKLKNGPLPRWDSQKPHHGVRVARAGWSKATFLGNHRDMTKLNISRRDALVRTGLLAGASVLGQRLAHASSSNPSNDVGASRPFLMCLNTATIRGQKLGIVKEIEITAQAGYDAIEPWVDSVQDYVKGGGSLTDLRKRINDSGLTVEGAIGFPEWIVDDDARRAKGMERAKREMDLMVQIGAKRFASPPAGATDLPKLDPSRAAERYLELLTAGQGIGLVPELELWGFSKNLNHLGECVGIAMETGHANACVLADVFHLYKGGSQIHGIRLLGPTAIQVLHMNDFPSDPPREKIDDSFRVFPGDGTAPINELLRLLHQTGGQKVLSLELFNRKYWLQDALSVAKAGLAKMKAASKAALT